MRLLHLLLLPWIALTAEKCRQHKHDTMMLNGIYYSNPRHIRPVVRLIFRQAFIMTIGFKTEQNYFQQIEKLPRIAKSLHTWTEHRNAIVNTAN